jgi:hypothetical protein
MADMSPAQYDALERAVIDGRRIVLYRRGTEYTIIPTAIRVDGSREWILAVHPTTGERMRFAIDEADSIEVIPR